jgi:isopentenyldiphosphate isomerase
MSCLSNDDELFDLVDDQNVPLGRTERRAVVHRGGLWHRSVHVVLLGVAEGVTGPGAIRILLQRRAEGKKVSPGHWDLSCAEHLSAGEDEVSAAVRGCQEELSFVVSPDDLTLVDTMPTVTEAPEHGIVDREFASIFMCTRVLPLDAEARGLVRADAVEVTALQWAPLPDVLANSVCSPLTPWCQSSLQALAASSTFSAWAQSISSSEVAP